MKIGRCVRCPRTNSAPLLGSRLMGKRRADADGRRFFDEFLCVKIPRVRATGVLQLDAPHTIIQFDDRRKLIGLAHVRLCVQRRLACSAGERPAGARVRSPVVWIAGWRETKDSGAYRQRLPREGDESPGRNDSERKSGLESA